MNEKRWLPTRRPVRRLVAIGLLAGAVCAQTQSLPEGMDPNNPGILEPISFAVDGLEVRIPNTDQSVDGVEQSTVEGEIVYSDALGSTSLLGHTIDTVTSPNDDMRLALEQMATTAQAGDGAGMRSAAADLMDILLGTTEGRIYDGFSMLNITRGGVTDQHVPGEYKMKEVRDTGRTYTSPFDGEERKIWEVDIEMMYYDGQIDSDTFLVRFPYGHHDDDVLHVNYRIYSLVEEDFSPTLVMLDKRKAMNTVQFPFKGMDSVWIAFLPGQVVDVTVQYPPVRQIRGVYTWGWRVHPPRIQFMQPIYEIKNAHTGEIELDPQGESFAVRNRTELTLDKVAEAAPEKKMYRVARAALDGASTLDILRRLTEPGFGPRGTWFEWADLAKNQTQLPPEAWDLLLEEDGLEPGATGDYNMISVYMNNEMYGVGPFQSEVVTWEQGETFQVKLINFDKHTHYFRNVDFGPRLNDDILRCCGGGETSFEIMNFKPSYGAPKVAEMQWRAGWGFRPHYDVVQQQGVFPRAEDRVELAPYTGGFGGLFWGYQYSEEARGGDFRFNPPGFIVSDLPGPDSLRDADGEAGLVIGQFTEGYGVAQMCPDAAAPGFCDFDLGPYNPHGVLNWPDPPNPDVEKTELRFPPFLRNPSQGTPGAGDIIPPTGAWRPFLWYNPQNGSLYIDPDDPSKGFWSDLTYSHGAPVFENQSIVASIELPRASGQVFYQFDDLFHDNAIFSPHPVAAGTEVEETSDEVTQVVAYLRGDSLRVRGEVSELGTAGGHARWITLVDGQAGAAGCTGTVLGSTQVENGRFVFRKQVADMAPGATLCAQSSVGGFAAAPVSR